VNLKKILEGKMAEEKELPLNEEIKKLCKEILGKTCSISVKTGDLLEKQMTIKVNKFLTEGDMRSLIPTIEALNGIKKIESWDVPEENPQSASVIIVTLEK